MVRPGYQELVGRQVIQFRNASSKTLVGAGQKTGAQCFQALRYVGRDRVDDQVINKLGAMHWMTQDRTLLSKQSRHVPAWMHPIVQQIVAPRLSMDQFANDTPEATR